MTKHKWYKVTFEMEYVGDEDEIKKVIDHQIDSLIDFESWPEIRGVYNAEIKEM